MPPLKGAFVVFQTPAPVPTDVIVFQFNSETLTRKIDPPQDNLPNKGVDAKGASGAAHQTRPPTETLTVAIELDASDRLADSDPVTIGVGLHPALAQLELLMYPPSSLILLNKGLAAAGVATVVPSFVPLVLFSWGTTRLLPVHVTSLQIVEQQFDSRLNPITARAEVGLTVLSQEDLAAPFATLAMVLQLGKEGLARIGTLQGAAGVTAEISF
jgi:hypothetical protein